MELEATWGRALRVWWAYMWRSALALIASVMGGWVLAFVVGFALALAGVSRAAIRDVCAVLGLLLGLGFSVIPIKLILGRRFGEFRLALLATTSRSSAARGPEETSGPPSRAAP